MPPKLVDELSKRIKELSQIVADHLEESKDIRAALAVNSADLGWLKKAFWALVGVGLTFISTLIIAIIVYLLNH